MISTISLEFTLIKEILVWMHLEWCAGWIEDGGSRELNSGQTLVWSNGVIGADTSNGELNPNIEPNSSNHCVTSNSTHTASNETPFVSGERCKRTDNDRRVDRAHRSFLFLQWIDWL